LTGRATSRTQFCNYFTNKEPSLITPSFIFKTASRARIRQSSEAVESTVVCLHYDTERNLTQGPESDTYCLTVTWVKHLELKINLNNN
jgi:hypothetical protein